MPNLSNTEQKVVLGILFVLGILLLTGWVVINEEGRMQAFTTQFEARSVERGASNWQANCATCHGTEGQGIANRAPALNNPRLFNGERITEMGWSGSLEDYIENAVSAGRPNSGSYWNGNVMPTWGQVYGGPMRPDEVQNMVRFIMNWQTSALDAENPPAVLQDFRIPTDETAAAAAPEVGDDEILSVLDELNARDPVGDPTNGEALYTAQGCIGCHVGGAVGPDTQGTIARVEEYIATIPELSDYTVRQYLVESIWNPNAYVDEQYQSGLMPLNFSETLSIDDLADIIAYLETQTQ